MLADLAITFITASFFSINLPLNQSIVEAVSLHILTRDKGTRFRGIADFLTGYTLSGNNQTFVTMPYIFKGNLSGFHCHDCFAPLGRVKVKLYQADSTSNVMALAVAPEKETFHQRSKDELRGLSKLLLAEGETDEFGDFSVELPEQHYKGGAFDLDFECGTVPLQLPKPPKPKGPFQFNLTTLQPSWRETEKERGTPTASYKYTLPAKWLCRIYELFDIWVICGKVTDCTSKKPLEGLKVIAFDVDLLQDDELGSDITDSNGKFRIVYDGDQFRKTILSPWLNVEWPAGPDYFFRIESVSGGVFLNEDRSIGHQRGRENAPNCFCIDFCVDGPIVDNRGDDLLSDWTGIGTAFTIPTPANLHDFDADGFAGAAKYGLTGAINLTGQAPHKRANGNHVEYRFLVSHVTTPNSTNAADPVPALANFTKIIGKDPGLLTPSRVCKVKQKVFPKDVLDVYATNADFDAEGWFDINRAIERTLTAAGEPPATFEDWDLIDTDTLLTLNTNVLTTSVNVPAGAADAGQPVPSANRMFFEKIAIRFEIREVINKATNSYAPLPGNGTTLNSMVINNTETFMKVDLNELKINGLCTPISGIIHAAYTVHHPLLMNASIHLFNNSNTVNKNLTDGFLTLSGNTNNTVNHHNNPSLQINTSPMDRCTYSMQLFTTRRLHNGEYALPTDSSTPILFFYEG